jgi:PAS domain S-box-containing protein
MVGYWDSKLLSKFANKAYSQYFQCDPDKLVGLQLRELLGESIYQANLPYVNRVLAGEKVTFERDLPSVAGYGVCHTVTHYLPDIHDGKVQGFYSLVHDISAQVTQRRTLDALYNQAPCGYHSLDGDGIIQGINDTELAWLGRSREEVLGKHRITDFMTAASAALFKANYSQFIESGRIQDIEFDFVRKDGSVLPCLLSATAVYDEQGHFHSTRTVLQDISVLRKQREALLNNHQELQRSERRHLALLSNLKTGLVVHAPDSSILFCNKQACSLLGLTQGQMLGKNAMDPDWHFVDPLGFPMHADDFPVHQVLRTLQSLDNLVLGVSHSASPTTVWLDVSAFPEFSANGDLQQVVVNFHDITQRRHAESARERASRALRLVTDTSITLARSADKAHLLQDICTLICNKGGYQKAWVGYAQQDECHSVLPMASAGFEDGLLSKSNTSWDAHSPDGQGPVGCAIRTGKSQVFSAADPHSSLRPRSASEQGMGCQSSISLPFTKRTGTKGALTIYTSHANAFSPDEVALLEELTANLVHELDTREERRLRQEAESASKIKSNFLANMSHEIRTPLNAISNMAYLIRKDGITPSQADKLDKLDHASQHLLSVLTDILDITKIDSGKLELEVAPLRGEDIVAGVVSMLIDKAKLKGIELLAAKVALPENLMGDATRLQQALVNYVSNAIKFTASGRIAVCARVLEESAQSALLRFEVSDTGVGIDRATLNRLFSAFEQADSSTTRQYGGTGLGLAITKQLAHLMGGHAGADSEPGVGSTFWFTARLLKSETLAIQVSPEQQSREQLMESLRTKYAGLRVLIAEDEPVNAEIARILLEDIGFEVDSADDGQEALEFAGKVHYPLILMDMQMPRLNGLEAAVAIKRLPNHAETPILAVTANAFLEDRKLCMEAGMNWFITKPVSPERLYATIFDALENPVSN